MSGLTAATGMGTLRQPAAPRARRHGTRRPPCHPTRPRGRRALPAGALWIALFQRRHGQPALRPRHLQLRCQARAGATRPGGGAPGGHRGLRPEDPPAGASDDQLRAAAGAEPAVGLQPRHHAAAAVRPGVPVRRRHGRRRARARQADEAGAPGGQPGGDRPQPQRRRAARIGRHQGQPRAAGPARRGAAAGRAKPVAHGGAALRWLRAAAAAPAAPSCPAPAARPTAARSSARTGAASA
jgi:hypothetical protein